jgi:type IV pilus assembly protein PilE
MNKCSKSGQRGVTLIELMIVVTIVGILAAVGVPSYRAHIVRVKRSEAKTELMAVAQQLERCYTRGNRYEDGGTNGCPGFPIDVPRTGGSVTYQITADIDEDDGQSFTLTAAPQGGQVRDTACGSLTLNQLGVRGVSSGADPATCW